MKNPRTRSLCSTGHALAIARWEDNREEWLRGGFYGLAAKVPDLQQMVGNGGTLWIVVSRRRTNGRRLYTLSFRLDQCRKKTYVKGGKFGKFAVVGNPNNSTLFATNDSRLLLMSLRFDPYRPIKSEHVIGKSIQTARCLSHNDIELLENHAGAVDQWSVFISYKRDDASLAGQLSEALQREGINVFRDQEALRGGQMWASVLENAVSRSRCLVLLMGAKTHESAWVKRELKYALDNNVRVIPVLAGGKLNKWDDFPNLSGIQEINRADSSWSDFVGKILKAL